MRVSEHELIERLKRLLPQRGAGIEVALGDDAAVLDAQGRLVWTIDTQVEGVHFKREWLTLGDLGWRSFNAAVSDVAAMGAKPVAALSSVIVPSTLRARGVEALAKGQAQAARRLRCPVVGGNLARGDELSVTTSVLGRVERAILRSGVRPGDEIWLVGDVGLAAAGFRLLSARAARQGLSKRLPRTALGACIRAWRRPTALVRRGVGFGGRAHALIDISDGLASEARHLARESRCRILLEEERLMACLRPELELAAQALGLSALELMLSGGDDYALLAAGEHDRRPRWARAIGAATRGSGAYLSTAAGDLRQLATGWDHFASA